MTYVLNIVGFAIVGYAAGSMQPSLASWALAMAGAVMIALSALFYR